jgi:hypothetical protein
MNLFRTKLFEHYEMRDLGELKWFLGVRVIRDRLKRKIWLCSDSYIDKIAHTFHLTDEKAPPTPIVTNELLPYDGHASPQEIHGYQRKIGSLTYATAIIPPVLGRGARMGPLAPALFIASALGLLLGGRRDMLAMCPRIPGSLFFIAAWNNLEEACRC